MVKIRRVGIGTYDVLFPGNPAVTAIGSALSDAAAAISAKQADGSFRVTIFLAGTEQNSLALRELPFTIVVSSQARQGLNHTLAAGRPPWAARRRRVARPTRAQLEG